MLRSSASLEDFSMRLLVAGKHSWCSEPRRDRFSPFPLFLHKELNYVLKCSESSESLSPGCVLQKDKKAKGSQRFSKHCGCALGPLLVQLCYLLQIGIGACRSPSSQPIQKQEQPNATGAERDH